jgi:hypothetical protein
VTKKEKKAWYASGKVSAEEVMYFDKRLKQMRIVWLPKVRGQWVRLAKQKKFHDTKSAALMAATAFREVMRAESRKASPLELTSTERR